MADALKQFGSDWHNVDSCLTQRDLSKFYQARTMNPCPDPENCQSEADLWSNNSGETAEAPRSKCDAWQATLHVPKRTSRYGYSGIDEEIFSIGFDHS